MGGGGRDLNPMQRDAAEAMGGTPVRRLGAHAEETVIEHAVENGMGLVELGTSRDFCSDCVRMIEGAGGVLTGPRSAVFPQQ